MNSTFLSHPPGSFPKHTQNQNSNMHHKFIPDAGQIPSTPKMNHMLPWRDLGDSPTISWDGVRKAGAEDKAGFAVPQPTYPPLLNRGELFPTIILIHSSLKGKKQKTKTPQIWEGGVLGCDLR